jgi:hypothetical protein
MTSLKQEYLSGDTLAVLSDRHGLSIEGVRRRLKKAGVQMRKQGNPRPVLADRWKEMTHAERCRYVQKTHAYYYTTCSRMNNDRFFENHSGGNAPEWKRLLDSLLTNP